MTKTNARLFLAVCLAILVVACGHGKGIPPEGADHAEDHALAGADFQAGQGAYIRGDYGTALKEWRPLAEQGDAQGTIQDADQAIHLNPQLAHSYYNRSLAYQQLNQRDRACQDMRKACELGFGRACQSDQRNC